ncbi:MAG TPA: cyclic nucleotide-binding domain-containing protein, partial [Anaerolineales bacterium]|nr:cyclic nucleotide-binding domain-containing protein [Anaerolineales bacterium]
MSVNLLARIPLFADLPPEELDRLMSALDVVNLNSGDMLFREGDIGEHLYIMVNGNLEITMGSGTEDEMVLNV